LSQKTVEFVPTSKLNFIPLESNRPDTVAVLTLDRPDVSNAMNAPLIDEMLAHLSTVRKKGVLCRALILRGAGKHFCAGADLGWMKESVDLGFEENLKEANKLSALFETLYRLPIPTIAVVQGAAFGGGVGLAACCDWTIALEGAKFCLSEVKVGLVAAVILPYLTIRFLPASLRRLVMTAAVFGVEEAREAGLIQRVAKAGDLEAALREEIGMIVAGEPQVQRTFKANHQKILEVSRALWGTHTEVGVETIAKARVSATGQAGIHSFLNKKTPDWVIQLPGDWKLP
jgi:methylglutaconyl-CoA hydratase